MKFTSLIIIFIFARSLFLSYAEEFDHLTILKSKSTSVVVGVVLAVSVKDFESFYVTGNEEEDHHLYKVKIAILSNIEGESVDSVVGEGTNPEVIKVIEFIGPDPLLDVGSSKAVFFPEIGHPYVFFLVKDDSAFVLTDSEYGFIPIDLSTHDDLKKINLREIIYDSLKSKLINEKDKILLKQYIKKLNINDEMRRKIESEMED